jgi:hypothetical protein
MEETAQATFISPKIPPENLESFANPCLFTKLG